MFDLIENKKLCFYNRTNVCKTVLTFPQEDNRSSEAQTAVWMKTSQASQNAFRTTSQSESDTYCQHQEPRKKLLNFKIFDTILLSKIYPTMLPLLAQKKYTSVY